MIPKRFIIIAGGSGSGKSTLSDGLEALLPQWTFLHLDDYQLPKSKVPMRGRFRNWDHPDAVDSAQVRRDITMLRAGHPITLSRRPQNQPSVDRTPATVFPGENLVLEGYLALWYHDVMKMADTRIFLDVPAALRETRRRWKMSPEYVRTVLHPMHDQYIEPTKVHADLVIDSGSSTPDQVLQQTLSFLRL